MTTLTEPAALPCLDLPLAAAVEHWAEQDPGRPAVTFLTYAGTDVTPQTLSYGELLDRSRAVARTVSEATGEDDVVAIMLPQGLDYLTAFLGCLLAGRVSVPLYGPDPRRRDHRLSAVLAHCTPAAVLHAAGDVDRIAPLLGDAGAVLIDAAQAQQGPPLTAAVPRQPEVAAYLQYTSGSTRTPAGVMVSDANLAAGMRQLRQAVPIGVDGPLVSWLPYFHDMGLVLTVAAVLQAGGHGIYMSPMAFVQRPARWLRAIHDHRATVTVVPNFGLDLAVGRVTDAERAGLDLSSLQALCNGSEPVRAASLEAFTAVHAPHGFDHTAHMPGYGLAETTLMVTAVDPAVAPTVLDVSRRELARGLVVTHQGSPQDLTRVVSCGPPMDQQVRIVLSEEPGRPAAGPGKVGEIWVQGPNVCLGYHQDPALTAQVFGARLHGEDGTWARTGDLGFVHDGELYVVGRSKDLIIVGGKNHYPADVESTVLQHVPELRQGAVAAFAHETGTGEALVLVIEIEPRVLRTMDVADVTARVRGAVAQHHELAAHEIVVARSGAIPKTTSGKLQRRACARLYADGQITSHRPATS